MGRASHERPLEPNEPAWDRAAAGLVSLGAPGSRRSARLARKAIPESSSATSPQPHVKIGKDKLQHYMSLVADAISGDRSSLLKMVGQTKLVL